MDSNSPAGDHGQSRSYLYRPRTEADRHSAEPVPVPPRSSYVPYPHHVHQHPHHDQLSVGSPAHYSSPSPYQAMDHPSPYSGPTTPIPVSMPSVSSSGYLDAFHGIPLPDVMNMEMDTGLSMDVNILSAQEHRDYRLLEEAQRQQQDLDDQQSGSRKKPRRQQRAQSTESNDSAAGGDSRSGKKQRGRPRLDTKDENAADRRRTQIRLAQRAYRMRKETTISSLRSRVSELEDVIDRMHHVFVEIQDAAVNHIQRFEFEERQVYGEQLNRLSERFTQLRKSAIGGGNSDDGDSQQEEESSVDRPSIEHRNRKRRSRDDGSGSGGSGTSGGPSSSSHQSWGYPLSHTRSTTSSYPPTSQPPPHHHASMFPPTPPQSYSFYFQETSFSRRLHRASLKRALTLLTTPGQSEAEINNVFAYTFCYKTRPAIISTLHRLLQNNALSIDERGDFSPRELQVNGYFKSDYAAYNDGTPHEVPAGCPDRMIRLAAYRQLARMGVNQKYLRPDDVERLLVEQGVLAPTNRGEWSDDSEAGSDGDGDAEYVTDGAMCNDLSEVLFPMPHSSPATEEEYDARLPSKVMVGVRSEVDPEILITELVKRGVCLGQFPAFKRTDVEAAVQAAAALSVRSP